MNLKKTHILLLFLCSTSLIGQVGIRHSEKVRKLYLDSLSNVVFNDGRNKFYKIENTSISPLNLGKVSYKKLLESPFPEKLIIDDHVGLFEEFKFKKTQNSDHNLLAIVDGKEIYQNANYEVEILDNGKTTISRKLYSEVIDCAEVTNQQMVLTQDTLYNLSSAKGFPTNFKATGIEIIGGLNIVLSSQDNGLWILKNGKFRSYYIPGIDFPKNINSIKYVQQYLWILDAESILYNYDSDRQILRRVAFNVTDFQLDYWNNLWYCSGKNIEYNNSFINKKPPIVNITDVMSNNNKVDIQGSIVLKHADNLEVFFESFYPPNPSKIEVEYRFNDSGSWQKAHSPLRLKNLQKGNYKFQVRARVGEDNFSNIKTFRFTIGENFFTSIWFYTLILFLGLFALAAFSLRRISKQNRNHLEEKRALKLELEVLKNKQKLGQVQMNPHFLFNTLNSINGLIAVDKKGLARKAINQFSKMMRSVLNFSFSEKITIEEEIAFLQNYLELEKLIRGGKFEYSINTEMYNKSIPPMMIQPFLENSIIHGLNHKKEKGHLELLISESGRYIKVVIKDDGIGRKEAKFFKTDSHQSRATTIVKKRIEMMDKWKEETPIEYVDLKKNQESAGTICILHIPK